jgi:predicted nucleic acid-binding Zn ribbon protein
MGPVRKLLYPTGVIFKGSGFYTTDYKAKGAKSGSEAGAASESGSKSSSSDSSAGSSKPSATKTGD